MRLPSNPFTVRAALAAAVTLPLTQASWAQIQFEVLDALPGADEPDTAALGVSHDGKVVFGFAFSDSGPGAREATRWTSATQPLGLGGLVSNNPFGHVLGSSPDGGALVGSTSRRNQLRAFQWTSSSGLTELADLGDAWSSEARGVSADGSIAVGLSQFREPGGAVELYSEATRWKNGVAQGLGFLPGGVWSEANAISADGRVVVGAADGPEIWGDHSAFAWTKQTGMIDLGDISGGIERGTATHVSAKGDVIVGHGFTTSSPIEWRVFRWTSATGIVGLGTLPGDLHAQPRGVSADGGTIVGWSGLGVRRHPFVWNVQSGMQDLSVLLEAGGVDLSDWKSNGSLWMEATGVSADGRTIVGHGRLDNHQRGWIVTLP